MKLSWAGSYYVVASFAPIISGLVLDHNIGKLPALGWNSWNAFDCNVSETNLLIAAKLMIDLGLKDAGYSYVNSDDCWSIKNQRDPVTNRMIPDPVKFPDGMAATASKIHALGFKMGIYSSAGTETCALYPASLGFEEIDAASFADWGLDYLKYDNCGVPSSPHNWTDKYTACTPDSHHGSGFLNGSCVPPATDTLAPPGYDWKKSNSYRRFSRMGSALAAQNRTILYSLCQWGLAGILSWGNDTASSWRMSGDITPEFSRILEILNENSFYMNYVNFWGHNDADMLEIGNGDLTMGESRTHFAFWSAMKSPLLIGADLEKISSDHVAILKNKYLLAFNQDDIHGGPATPYKWGINPDWTFNATHPAEYWSGTGKEGTLVLMMNTLDETVGKVAKWSEIPQLKGGDSYMVTDAWSGHSLGCVYDHLKVNVAAHDTSVLLVGQKCSEKDGVSHLLLHQTNYRRRAGATAN